LIADGGMAASGGDQVAGEGCQGFGQFDGDGPEPECDRVVGGVDVVEVQSADGRGALGVEQEQQPGDTVVGVEGVVVQQPFGLLPALFMVQWTGGAGPSGGGEP
jgi:hypothetical protein